MIDLNLATRKPLHRIVDYLFLMERDHMIEGSIPDEFSEDIETYNDDELFQFCVQHDIDHIWIDVYMLRELLDENDDDEDRDDETDGGYYE